MRGFNLIVAVFALVQCLRYGRGALRFLRPGGEPRRQHLLAFVITALGLVLLASALNILLHGPAGR